ncbi:MAG: ABC transporter permease [Planctomycetota bacterium]|jgi:putative ABC transport system permease protein
MFLLNYFPLVWKHIVRNRLRSGLTIGGVATAMFLFCSVNSMQDGVQEATTRQADETRLVVYRKNRFCPFSSKLPQHYTRQIADLPGVAEVVPTKILLGNCRTSLAVLTFRGVPADTFTGRDLTITEGSLADWRARSDAALVSRRIMERRNLKLGDRIEMAGVTITVAGVFESENIQDQESAYTHLDFLQQSSGAGLGVVTQFVVKVDDSQKLDEVAASIDKNFSAAQDPTATWSESAFTARAVKDITELVHFAGWLGWGALAAVFALVANAIVLSVQDRVRDHAVLQTLGYGSRLIAGLIMTEAALLSLIGGAIGLVGSGAVLYFGQFSLAMEGLGVQVNADVLTLVTGFILCLILGIGAGLVPAWQAGQREIAACFRSV